MSVFPLFFAFATVSLFILHFLIQGVGAFDFWWEMSLVLVLLFGTGVLLDRSFRGFLQEDILRHPVRKVLLGILSAGGLYGLFFMGHQVAGNIFSRAADDIQAVYAFREGASALRIGLLMVFIIGPGEELVWRSMLQRHMEDRLSPLSGYLLAAFLYAAVHAVTGNTMLVTSAALCGLYWGALFLRFRSPLLVAVSHTAWDILIFVLYPIGL